MTTVSGSFTAEGVSDILRIRKTVRNVTYSVSGTYSGYVVLEQATTTAELSWEVVRGPFYTGGGSGVLPLEAMGRLRFRSIGQNSGTATYTMADSDAIYAEERNPNNERTGGRTEGGDYIVGDLYVGGHMYIGDPPEEIFAPGPASETEAGVVELATNLEAAAGVDTSRAITPANLAAAVNTLVNDASASTKGKVELAVDAEAITGTDTTRAVTPANLAAAVTTHVSAGSETVAGKLELATNAETVTGTDNVRATHPAGVKAAIDTAIALLPAATPHAWTMDSTIRSGNFNAMAGKAYLCDTSGGQFTATLPASPSVNDVVGFIDYATAFGTNKLILGRNGNKINEASFDFDLDVANVSGFFVWTGSTNGWMPF